MYDKTRFTAIVSAVTILFAIFCDGQNTCTIEQNCGKCITKPNCAWCKNPVFEERNHRDRNHPRCNTMDGHKKNQYCLDPSYIENPKTEEIKPQVSVAERHISPALVKAKLRVGQPFEFEMTYSESQNKPLDLYYIMDLSATMRDDRDTVAQQGYNLAQALQKLTTDLKIGFGSFIDKPVMPFVSSAQLEGKKLNGQQRSVPPYGFKNHLSLTPNIRTFTKTVNEAEISANLDAPEGGLDAIMQAITCNETIGWRERARKLIILATDGPFHIAGDGKLAGIVVPNDGICHMKDNLYTHSTQLDYPSVAQINSMVLEKKAHVIFAIASEHLNLYKQLSQRISNSNAAGLNADSRNVVDLVKGEYQKISELVKIETDTSSYSMFSLLSVKFWADCENNGIFTAGNQCDKVKVGKAVKFKIRVELTQCPRRDDLKTPTFNVDFTTFDLRTKDFLRLEIEPICNCECSNQTQSQNIAGRANICGEVRGASLICGQCHCSPDRQGRNCECSKNDDTSSEGDANCRMNSTSTEICSNKGKCECDVCQCNNDVTIQYSGKYCQFNDSACRDEGSYDICSKRGDCEEGKCICRPEGRYEGDKCQCEVHKVSCIEPGSSSNKVCNGNGECSCEGERKCRCKPNWTGLYCQKCSINCGTTSQLESRCTDKTLQMCIKCHLKNKINDIPKNVSNCQTECSSPKWSDIQFYHVSLMDSISAKDNEIRCTLKYSDKCNTEFVYSYQRNPRLILNVVASTGINCAKDPPILWYALIVIGAVLLIGIFLLLLWKLITHIHDKREYGRFEKERAGARWEKGENPLYSKPLTEFQNPAYKG